MPEIVLIYPERAIVVVVIVDLLPVHKIALINIVLVTGGDIQPIACVICHVITL